MDLGRASRPLYIFFHVCMKGRYLEIVLDCLHILHSSGLYSQIDKLYFATLGDVNQIPIVKQHMGPKGHHLGHDNNITHYERWTLHELWRLSHSEPPFYALYIHSKGISRPESKAQPWRHLMLHFTANNWPLSISFLEQGWGSVGTNMYPYCNSLHYSGNYWWVRSESIQSLSIPIGSSYLDPEMWIGKIADHGFSMATLYQHPQWRCLNTQFHKFRYQNKLDTGDIQSHHENTIIIWDNIPKISFYGVYQNYYSFDKEKLAHHKTQGSFVFDISRLNFMIGDPSFGNLKMWVFQGATDSKLYCFVEGFSVKIHC